jgi:monovalent cation:H+ antiporter-2, CPA2 family
LSLPMLIAIVRKWQAFGMLVSEMSVSRAAAGERTNALRAAVSSIVFVSGCAALLLITLVLSSAVLPSGNLFFVAALLLLVITLLLWRVFVRLHARAQTALHETLNEPPLPHPHHVGEESALSSLLKDAGLVMLPIAPQSAVAGKVIAELQLRTLTGASIVGIERDGEKIINPGVSEEIRAGDSVLLLGSQDQLERARKLLAPD